MVLALYPSLIQPLSTPEPLGNAGGLSGSCLWRFQSGLGMLLARAWPIDGPRPFVLQQIHDWLAETEDLGFVPVPVRGRDGRTLYGRDGRFWEVTRQLWKKTGL